jgi:hypothetical protein
MFVDVVARQSLMLVYREGAAMSAKDSYFLIDQISYLRPITDLSSPTDQRHLLRIVCKNGSCIKQVTQDGIVAGNSSIEIIDFYFAEIKEMNDWCQYLSNSQLRLQDEMNIPDIPSAPHETVQSTDIPGNG